MRAAPLMMHSSVCAAVSCTNNLWKYAMIMIMKMNRAVIVVFVCGSNIDEVTVFLNSFFF